MRMRRVLVFLFASYALPQDAQLQIPSFANGPAGRPPSGVVTVKLPDQIEFVVNGTRIMNRPYSGTETLETNQTLTNGAVTMRRSEKVWRDSEGRMRREKPLYAGSDPPDTPTIIEILDSAAGVYYVYITNAQKKVAYRVTFPPGPNVRTSGPILPTPGPGDDGGVVEEIPPRSIEGLETVGRRETRKSPPNMVWENWTSMQIWRYVLFTETSPNLARVSKLTNVSTQNPPAALFAPPPDYNVQDSPFSFTIPFP